MKLPKEKRAELNRQVQEYFDGEFELELGDLRAGLVLEFFDWLLGPIHYNEAIADARALVANRADSIQEELLALERETDPRDRRGRPA